MTESEIPSPPPQAPRSMRTFYLIWAGQFVSMLGSGLTSFALAVWIYQQSGQATPFALTVLFGNLPYILISPLAGSLADRLNRRWIIILSDSGNALVTLIALLLAHAGMLQVWHIYLIAAAGSVCSAFQSPAFSASVSMLVPREQLPRANGLLTVREAAQTLVTPILAAALFMSIGLSGIILIDFITYFFALGTLLLVRIPQPPSVAPTQAEKPSIWQDAVFGWKYLYQRTGLFILLWYYALVNFVLTSSLVLIGPMLLSRYPASTYGILETVTGAAMLVGGIVMSIWKVPKRRVPAIIIFISTAMLGLIVAGIRPHPLFVGAGMFILLSVIPLAAGYSNVLFQSKVDAGIQGRVFAIRGMIASSVTPLAQISIGPLADKVFEPLLRPGGALSASLVGKVVGVGPGRGMGLILVVFGAAAILVSLLAYANPRLRRIEDELPDAAAG
jgi:MFS transporter, DHA3 family, macrolide efflux protein